VTGTGANKNRERLRFKNMEKMLIFGFRSDLRIKGSLDYDKRNQKSELLQP
jgi:hypothetical protein